MKSNTKYHTKPFLLEISKNTSGLLKLSKTGIVKTIPLPLPAQHQNISAGISKFRHKFCQWDVQWPIIPRLLYSAQSHNGRCRSTRDLTEEVLKAFIYSL